jgi:hypothetical protein
MRPRCIVLMISLAACDFSNWNRGDEVHHQLSLKVGTTADLDVATRLDPERRICDPSGIVEMAAHGTNTVRFTARSKGKTRCEVGNPHELHDVLDIVVK